MSLNPQRAQYMPGIQRIDNFAALGNGVAIDVTNSSAALLLPTLPDGNNATDVLIVNPGTKNAFISFGNSAPTVIAPVNGTPANGIIIPAGVVMTLDKGAATYIGTITTGTDTTTIYIYQGVGS